MTKIRSQNLSAGTPAWGAAPCGRRRALPRRQPVAYRHGGMHERAVTGIQLTQMQKRGMQAPRGLRAYKLGAFDLNTGNVG